MNAADMKKLIQEKLEHTTDEKLLEQILHILNTQPPLTIDATRYMAQLFAENDNLLKRLS